jgi:hypothetical protein
MEKHGKIKLIKYTDEENIAVKHTIVLDKEVYIAYIETYDQTILVKPYNIPQWLIEKIRNEKVNRNDDVIVTVKDSGETIIEREEAIVELPKSWSKEIEELFEDKFTTNEIKEVLDSTINRLNDLFVSDIPLEAKMESREEILRDLYNKFNIKLKDNDHY